MWLSITAESLHYALRCLSRFLGGWRESLRSEANQWAILIASSGAITWSFACPGINRTSVKSHRLPNLKRLGLGRRFRKWSVLLNQRLVEVLKCAPPSPMPRHTHKKSRPLWEEDGLSECCLNPLLSEPSRAGRSVWLYGLEGQSGSF